MLCFQRDRQLFIGVTHGSQRATTKDENGPRHLCFVFNAIGSYFHRSNFQPFPAFRATQVFPWRPYFRARRKGRMRASRDWFSPPWPLARQSSSVGEKESLSK